jgi:hypothetical protein
VIDVLRRLLLWTAICCVSAAPSFSLAWLDDHNRAAMVLGIGIFILLYTAATSTPLFQRLANRPFVRPTLYIGYGTRLALSVAAIAPYALITDIVPGMISLGFVGNVLKIDTKSFTGTLLTTIVQGTLLNLLIGVFMLLVYAAQCLFCKRPPDQQPRGFEVLPVAAARPDE